MSDLLRTAPTLESLRDRREAIHRLLRKYRALSVRVFGSVARNEATAESDIDLLVEFQPDASLYDLAGLKLELEDLLGCEVDVADAATPNERFLRRIASDLVNL